MPTTTVKPCGGLQQASPVEVYGLGTTQRFLDEIRWLEQSVEKSVHASHRVEDSLDALIDAISSLTKSVDDVLKELKLHRELLKSRRSR